MRLNARVSEPVCYTKSISYINTDLNACTCIEQEREREARERGDRQTEKNGASLLSFLFSNTCVINQWEKRTIERWHSMCNNCTNVVLINMMSNLAHRREVNIQKQSYE